MNFDFDDVDQKILSERSSNRDAIEGHRVGDFVKFPTGQVERISFIGGNNAQTAPGGSFYLGDSGYSSFSGALNPGVPLSSLTLTDEKKNGKFWFFHRGIVGAHRGVDFETACRVFETSAAYEGFLGKPFV